MKQKTINQVVETRDRQFSKGIVVAMSCEILKINDETYRVQSESAVDRYYVVRFSDGEPDVLYMQKLGYNHSEMQIMYVST